MKAVNRFLSLCPSYADTGELGPYAALLMYAVSPEPLSTAIVVIMMLSQFGHGIRMALAIPFEVSVVKVGTHRSAEALQKLQEKAQPGKYQEPRPRNDKNFRP